jgi:hypothetical protein
MSGYQVYKVGDADIVIAESAEDARLVWCEVTGEDLEACYEEHEVTPVDPEKVIGIWCDKDGKIAEPGHGAAVARLTAAMWVAREGRGFLCSSEF